MPYTPNSGQIYNAAFSGAMSGMAVSMRAVLAKDSTVYDKCSMIAGAFAQELDTIWASSSANLLDVYLVLNNAISSWTGRTPVFSDAEFLPDTYADLATGIIAVVTSSGNYYASQGITPPSTGGGNANAISIQGVPVASTPPVQSAVPVYDTTGTEYDIRKLTQDDIDPGFTITGFSGGSTVEIGATVVNPVFTASYTATPTSAHIDNSDGIDSPLAMVSPFTSGTVTGAFTHNAQATVAFTLTAVGATTKTAGSNIVFSPRAFGGVGTAGATSATASGNSATLVGATGSLASLGLFGNVVGQTFGPFNPSTQKIYLFLIGAGHTFVDAITGFQFDMGPGTFDSFVNQNGIAVPMYLYESTNLLATPFTIRVAS